MQYRLASEKVVGTVIDDEAIVINLDTGMYFGMEGASAYVWQWTAAGVDDGILAAALAEHYPDAPVQADLHRLLNDMVAAQLLTALDSTDAGVPPPDDTVWPVAYSPLAMQCYDDVAEMVALDPPLPELGLSATPAKRA